MRVLLGGALVAVLAGSSAAQAVDPLLVDWRNAHVLTPPIAEPRSSPVYGPAQHEEFAADESYPDDHFRLDLLAPGHADWWMIPTEFVDLKVLLVVQTDYLNKEELERLVADIQEATSAIPRLTGRPPAIRGRVTIYAYDLAYGPLSDTGVPGVRPGEIGVMLRHVKERRAPLFHEMTHLLAGVSSSQSLSEGIADWVQNRMRPGRAESFVPAGVNLRQEVRDAIRRHAPEPKFFTKVGSFGEHYSARSRDAQARADFYYCSWSFVDFLIRHGGMRKFWEVADAGGFPDDYQRIYGVAYRDLLVQWITDISSPAPL